VKTSYISFSCSRCGTISQRNRVNWHPEHKNHFCSRECRILFPSEQTKVDQPCGHCGDIVTRRAKIQQESKSGHIFCNHSCAAKYRNAHKTTGTRRSKLEVWLEDRLRELYPDLDIHCNRTDAINGELDFYFPGLKLAFELNGIFHYEPIYGGPEKLTRIQNNDARKMAACLERGIELCVVDTSQADYFKSKVAEKFLGIVRGVLDKVIDQRTRAGWAIQSTDPTRGQTASPTAPVVEFRPPFLATHALERSLQWMAEIRDGKITRTELGTRENVNPSRISQLLNLVYLPDEMKTKLTGRDPSVGFLTIQQATELGRENRGFRGKHKLSKKVVTS